MDNETPGAGGEVPWYQDLNSPPDQPEPPTPPSFGDAPTTAFTAPSNPPLGGQPPTAPPAGPPGSQIPSHDGPGTPEPDTGRSGATKILLIGAAVFVALVAIGGGGFIALKLLSGGGAESPEAAVQTVVDSINQQDVVLAASVINPDELPMITDLASRISEARDRLGVGASGTVKGTSVTLDDVDMDADELTDDVARITIDSADLSGSLDEGADETPAAVRDIVTAFEPEFYDEDSDSSNEFDGTLHEFSVIAVRSGGGWYLSPAMSALDTALMYSYESEDYEGDFDEVVDSGFFDSGSDSPEDAVEDLADALEEGDPEKVAELLPSDVGAGVAVYADWIFESLLPYGYNEDGWKVDDLELEVEGGPNGTKKVLIRQLEVSNGYDEAFAIDGLEVDDDDGPWSDLTSNKGREVPYFRLIQEALGDSLYVLTREVDEGWKVDPVATALAISSQIMEKVDSRVLAGVTASTDGDPDATLELGERVTVELDEYGHAAVEAPTEAEKLYSLVVSTAEADSVGLDYGTIRVGNEVFSRGRIASYDSDEHDPYLFTADGPTRIGIGMLLENPGDLEVEVVEVPIANHELGKSIKGELASSVEIHTVDGIGAEYLRATCSGGVLFGEYWTEDFEVSDSDGCLNGYFASEGTWANEIEADGRLVLVAYGDVGDEYELLIEEDLAGFDNGEREITVTVSDSETVAFSKPEGSWYIEVDSSTSADIDASVSLNGDEYDYNGGYNSSFDLDLPYEGGEGEVELWSYSGGSSSTSFDSGSTSFGSGSGSSSVTLRLVEE